MVLFIPMRCKYVILTILTFLAFSGILIAQNHAVQLKVTARLIRDTLYPEIDSFSFNTYYNTNNIVHLEVQNVSSDIFIRPAFILQPTYQEEDLGTDCLYFEMEKTDSNLQYKKYDFYWADIDRIVFSNNDIPKDTILSGKAISGDVDPFSIYGHNGHGLHKIRAVYRYYRNNKQYNYKSNYLKVFFVEDTIGKTSDTTELFSKARNAFNNGKYLVAGNLLRKLIERKTTTADLYMQLAECYFKTNNYPNCEVYTEDAITKSPSNTQYKLRLIEIHNHFKEYKKALDACDELIKSIGNSRELDAMRKAIFDKYMETENAKLRPNVADSLK